MHPQIVVCLLYWLMEGLNGGTKTFHPFHSILFPFLFQMERDRSTKGILKVKVFGVLMLFIFIHVAYDKELQLWIRNRLISAELEPFSQPY